MYRHQQQISAPSGHLPTHSWFNPGYYHSAHAQLATTPATSYNVQEPQIYMHMGYPQNCIQRDLPDFVHNEIPMLQSTQKQVEAGSIFPPPPPPVPVGVKKEMCSPGGQWEGVSSLQTQCLENRPLQAGSPYECEEKTPFQTQANPDIPGGKTRTKDKYRVVYTDHQRTELEREYTYHNRYITIKRKSELAANLGLSERQIKIWFQNRRAKERKQTKKLQSQEEPRMWNNHPTHPNGAQYDYQDFVHNKIPPLQPQGQRVGVEGVLPSPPISDSGSELCCPGEKNNKGQI